MTLTQGHISEAKVILNTYLKSVSGYILKHLVSIIYGHVITLTQGHTS